MGSLRDGNWVPERLMRSMEFEYLMHPDEIDNPDKTHRRMMREALPYVTAELRNIALNDLDTGKKLQAINMVLERTMGKAGVDTTMETAPAEALFADLEKGIKEILGSA